jgi:hypothetical protein
MINYRWGHLEVVLQMRIGQWLAECDCGNLVALCASALGHRSSCGCRRQATRYVVDGLTLLEICRRAGFNRNSAYWLIEKKGFTAEEAITHLLNKARSRQGAYMSEAEASSRGFRTGGGR